MITGHCHQTAQFLILYANFLVCTMGFGVPSPVDIHTALTSLDSLQHLHGHVLDLGDSRVSEAMKIPNTVEIKNHITTEMQSLYQAIKQATVTKRVDNALAGTFAEAAAGATGALVSRKTTVDAIGRRKRDSLETKMKSTGAFFGAKVGVEGITRILGIPRPLALLLATIIGSFVSTTVKAEGRMADQSAAQARLAVMKERRAYYCIDGEFIINMDMIPETVSEPAPRPLSRYFFGDGELLLNQDPPALTVSEHRSTSCTETLTDGVQQKGGVSLPETAGDIGKWMVYDDFVVSSGLSSGTYCWTDYDKSTLHVLFGTVAAVAGKYIQDLADPKGKGRETTDLPGSNVRYSQAAVEGGVLFGTYKATLTFLNTVVPDDWNKVFPFETALEHVEKILLP